MKGKKTSMEPEGEIVLELTTELPENSVIVAGGDMQPSPLGYMTGTECFPGGPIPRTRKKVSIVGFAPSSMEMVKGHFGNPDMEIWGLNQLYVAFPAIVPHCTRWFQFHARHSYDANERDLEMHKWMQGAKIPIYTQVKEPDIPFSVPLPRDALLSKFWRYFTNSISWEIALAIHEGFEEIHIFGVDMAQDSEYSFQRPSCELFIGWALGMGIRVIIPDASDLCKAMWLYPFESESGMRGKIDARRQELRNRAMQAGTQKQQLQDQHMQLLGALENLNYFEKAFCETPKMWPVESEGVKPKS